MARMHRVNSWSVIAEDEHTGDDLFDRACAHVAAIKLRLSMSERLQFYSLYKQALHGDAGPVPSLSSGVIEVTKHQNWASRRGMSAADARAQYVAQVDTILGPRWKNDRERARSPNVSVSSEGSRERDLDGMGDGQANEAESLRRQILALQTRLRTLNRHESMRGWLYKWVPHSGGWLQATGSSRWQRRFFVLSAQTLLYYRAEVTKVRHPARAHR
jgi:acyl-CoA-binding protein